MSKLILAFVRANTCTRGRCSGLLGAGRRGLTTMMSTITSIIVGRHKGGLCVEAFTCSGRRCTGAINYVGRVGGSGMVLVVGRAPRSFFLARPGSPFVNGVGGPAVIRFSAKGRCGNRKIVTGA